MSEIKTTCRGTSRLIEVATMTHEEYLNLHTQGEKELRAAYEALQKENAELKESLGKSLESLKNDCKAFADCRPRPYSMSQTEQEAWFSCWNSIYDDINNLDLSKYAETKKAVL